MGRFGLVILKRHKTSLGVFMIGSLFWMKHPKAGRYDKPQLDHHIVNDMIGVIAKLPFIDSYRNMPITQVIGRAC